MKNYKNSINKQVVIFCLLAIQAFLIVSNFTLGQAIDPKNGVQISGDYYICGGRQAQYEYSVIGGCNSYTWSIEPLNFGTIISGQNTNKIKVTWASNGIATLKVKTGTGCTDGGYSSKTLSFKVEVAPGKSPTSIKSSSGSFTFKCGSTVTLSTEEAKYLEYNWELPAGLTGVSKTNKINVKVSDNFAGGYIYVTPVFPKSACGHANDYEHPRLTAGASACSSTPPPPPPPAEQDISGNSICCNQEFYLTGIPLPLNSPDLTSKSGSTLTIQWESSLDGYTYANIPGATNQALTFNTAINKTTYFRRRVESSVQVSYSNVVKVMIKTVDKCSSPKPIGEALYFDGDDRVSFETLPEDDKYFSLDFWVNSIDYSKEQTILSLGDLRIGLKDKKLYIKNIYRKNVLFGSDKDYSHTNYSSVLTDIEDNSWHHFQVVFERGYVIKGIWNNSTVIYEGPPDAGYFNTRTNKGYIGYEDGTPGFNGYIRDVRIWSSEEGDCKSLLSFFPLDDVCGERTILDISGHNTVARLGDNSRLEFPSFNENITISTQAFSYSTIVKAQKTLTINGDIQKTANSRVVFKAKKEIKIINSSLIGPNVDLVLFQQDEQCPPLPPPLAPLPFSVVIGGNYYGHSGESIALSAIVNGGNGTYSYRWYYKSAEQSDYQLDETANDQDYYSVTPWIIDQNIKVIVTSGSETAEAEITVYCDNCTYEGQRTSNNRLASPPSQEQKSEVKVFPNPSSGIYTIDFADKKITGEIIIRNILGKKILSTKSIEGNNALQIDLRGQLPGIYFIHVVTTLGPIKKKIILNNKSE